MVDQIGQAVDACLSQADYDFVTIQYTGEDRVASIQVNSRQISLFQVRMIQMVNSAMDKIVDQDIPVALGSFTGIQILQNTGPAVTLHIQSVSFAENEIEASMEDAGINQTKHSIKLKVQIEINTLMTGYEDCQSVETEFLLCETVIVGEVPETLFDLDEGGEEILDKISNYQ